MAGFRIEGNTSGNLAEVDAANQLKIVSETDAIGNPENIGDVRIFGENDQGSVTGVVALKSPEVDVDYRQRAGLDLLLDDEVFNYGAQNTGKHYYNNTTMTMVWTSGVGIVSNGASITTVSTGAYVRTQAVFPNYGVHTLSGDFEVAFSAQPTTNSFVEFGLTNNASTTSGPSDGVFFRLNSAGLQGIVANSSTEVSTGVFPVAAGSGTPWTYTNGKRHQFIVYVGMVEAQFWVNDGAGAILLGSIPLPSAVSRICMSTGLYVHMGHRILGGTAGGVLQATFGSYNVRLGGSAFASLPSERGASVSGAYQGLSGGTMGSLANYANSANPTAAVPTNTAAALGTGLGGQFWETATLAVNTDGIICSYQVPAYNIAVANRRLCIRGIALTSYIQTVIAGGPYVAQYSLAFGHTAVSLATSEAATTKAPRRIALPFTQLVTAAQAVSTLVAQAAYYADFSNAPIYVNSGEFVALVTKHVGTVGSSGVVAHVVTFMYGWE